MPIHGRVMGKPPTFVTLGFKLHKILVALLLCQSVVYLLKSAFHSTQMENSVLLHEAVD